MNKNTQKEALDEIQRTILNNETLIETLETQIIELENQINNLEEKLKTIKFNIEKKGIRGQIQLRTIEITNKTNTITNIKEENQKYIEELKKNPYGVELLEELEETKRLEEEAESHRLKEEKRVKLLEEITKPPSDSERETIKIRPGSLGETIKKRDMEREMIDDSKHPLMKNDDETIDISVPSDTISSVVSPPSTTKFALSSSKTRRKTTPIPSKSKTKKKRPTPEGIELQDLRRNRLTPEPKEDLSRKRITPEEIQEAQKILQPLGFRETLKPSAKIESSKIDKNICQNILTNGTKVNTKYFFPSEFPKITKINPITVTNKKGGQRKSRKRRKIS